MLKLISTVLLMGAALITHHAYAAEITLRLGAPDPVELPYMQALTKFEELVEAGSDGRIDVQLFPSGQLGEIVEQIENVRQGSQEMAASTPAWFSQFYPGIDVLEMPFLVTDWSQVGKLIASDAFTSLAEDASRETGIKLVGVMPAGFRNVLSNRGPITQLSDFNGLKIRLQNSPVHMATFSALGAVPISIAAGEVYQATQAGLVDALENSNAILLGNKYYEVAKHVSITRHFFGTMLLYMNPAFYDGLSQEDQELIDSALDEAEKLNLELAQAAEEDATRQLSEAGATITELSPELAEEIRARVAPVYEEFGSKFGDRLESLKAAIQ